MPTTTRNKTKLYHAEEDKALFNFSSSIIGSNQQSVHYISQLSLLTQYLHTMNFNPARTQYINQSPKLPRATGLASTGACSAPALEEEKHASSRIGRDIKHFFDCFHQDSSMDPIFSSAARNATTQVESRSRRRYPIAPSNNTPASQPFFYESFYGQEENKKHLHCRDRHRGGTLSSAQSMSRRRKLDSILKSVDDLLVLKSNRHAY
jgi:hypothetical protein